MLDRAMQQFADEMLARPRPPRRSSTRRAEQIDNLSAPGAQRLSEMIRSFWSAAGFNNIRTEIVHSGGSGEAPVWGIRSNLRNALPPQETRDGPRVEDVEVRFGASNRRLTARM